MTGSDQGKEQEAAVGRRALVHGTRGEQTRTVGTSQGKRQMLHEHTRERWWWALKSPNKIQNAHTSILITKKYILKFTVYTDTHLSVYSFAALIFPLYTRFFFFSTTFTMVSHYRFLRPLNFNVFKKKWISYKIISNYLPVALLVGYHNKGIRSWTLVYKKMLKPLFKSYCYWLNVKEKIPTIWAAVKGKRKILMTNSVVILLRVWLVMSGIHQGKEEI